MDIRFIERLIELVERSTLAELEYSEGGERVRIVRTATGVVALPPGAPHPGSDAEDDAVEQIAAGAGATLPRRSHFIAAGIVGAFYRAASPAEPAFVEVGSAIVEGQTLGLVEAMKTFNAVEADRAGTIAAILVEDGAMVEPGTLLFEIDVG